MSYKEFIELSKKNLKDEETFWNFVKRSSLPNRCQFENENNIKDYLHIVFDSIILRDLVDRLDLKDTILFDLSLQYIVDITGRGANYVTGNIICPPDTNICSFISERTYPIIYISILSNIFCLFKIYF